jgi:hypothetical protein
MVVARRRLVVVAAIIVHVIHITTIRCISIIVLGVLISMEFISWSSMHLSSIAIGRCEWTTLISFILWSATTEAHWAARSLILIVL